jgi:hypothetical protein
MKRHTRLPALAALAIAGGAGVAAAGPPPPYWTIHGNGGTTAGHDFLGTTDAQDLVIATDGQEAVRVDVGGHLGIGTHKPGIFGVLGPVYSLDVRNANPYSVDTVVGFSSDAGQAGLHLHSQAEEAFISFGTGKLGHDANSSIGIDRDTSALHVCVSNGANCQLATEVRLTVEPSGDVGIGTKTPASALQVVGYAQLDLTAGAPPAADCDEPAERGRMKVDGAAALLYVCVDSGWAAK